MGFLKKVFNAKKNKSQIAARNPFNLQINDIVDYDLVEYQVIGKIIYSDKGYVWYDYHLFDGKGHLWLYAADDDQAKMGLFRKLNAGHEIYSILQESIPSKLQYKNKDYSLIEEGIASIEVEGKVGARDNQQIRYWDYETANNDQISVENRGNELEISIGRVVKESLLEFYPAG